MQENQWAYWSNLTTSYIIVNEVKSGKSSSMGQAQVLRSEGAEI
jgi:hypothetical protein